MARLIKIAALISILLLIIIANNASAFRTTITTIEIDEPNMKPSSGESSPSQSQRCREQAQRQDLSQCEEYVTQSRRKSISVLALKGIENPQQEVLQQCCEQIKQVEEQCQCDVVKSVVQKQQQKQRGEREEEKLQQVVERARDIPRYCSFSQPCEIRSV